MKEGTHCWKGRGWQGRDAREYFRAEEREAAGFGRARSRGPGLLPGCSYKIEREREREREDSLTPALQDPSALCLPRVSTVCSSHRTAPASAAATGTTGEAAQLHTQLLGLRGGVATKADPAPGNDTGTQQH